MKKREAGFSLLEILITLAILGVVLAAITDTFVNLLKGYKQQGKIAETGVEGIIGLEMLRRDIESAGYGLPWVIPAGATYTERSDYGDAPSNPPRAILSGNGAGWNTTDYLVIKAVNVARNSTCSKWTNLFITGGTATTTIWDPADENLEEDDRVIVISPGATEALARALVVSGGSFTTTFELATALAATSETRIVYGINNPDTSTGMRRPFHRADYYVAVPASSSMPSRCAPGTGILYKNVLNQGDDSLGVPLPIVDCVADMQVIFGIDNDGDGDFQTDTGSDGYDEDISTQNAQWTRERVKQVRLYILTHEGQKDRDFTYPSSTISLGGDVGLGRTFNLATVIGSPEYKYYRWKVYTLVVRPNNLR